MLQGRRMAEQEQLCTAAHWLSAMRHVVGAAVAQQHCGSWQLHSPDRMAGAAAAATCIFMQLANPLLRQCLAAGGIPSQRTACLRHCLPASLPDGPHPPVAPAPAAPPLQIVGEFGLRNKRELWRVQMVLSKLRARARDLLTLDEKDPK